jgi:hypothetical protein
MDALLEAFVMLEQQSTGASSQTGMGPICDGTERPYWVRVQSNENGFKAGRTHVSAFVLLCDETGGECVQGQESQYTWLHARQY